MRGFVGAKLSLDSKYEREREACSKDAARVFKERFAGGKAPVPPRGPGPVELGIDVLNVVPAYARLSGYNRARKALAVAQMAHAILPPEAAQSLIAAIIADTPALQAAIASKQAKIEARD